MKVKVVSEFIDAHTRELHPVGEILDLTEERFSEIVNARRKKFITVLDDTRESSTVDEKQKTAKKKKKGE